MSSPAAFDQLARTLGQRLPRRAALRAAATVLAGGVAGTMAATPAHAAGVRRTVCRREGVGCTRDAQCCVGQCRTGRDHPRQLRNRCGCRPGYGVCSDNVCTDLNTLERCGYCEVSCNVGLADACINGECLCGADAACDPLTADACVSGACQCGDDPSCVPGVELCTSGSCLSGDCVLVSGAAACVVDPDLNVYQFTVDSQYSNEQRCSSSSECVSFMPDCGVDRTCICGAFFRTQPGGSTHSWGICAAYLTAYLIV